MRELAPCVPLERSRRWGARAGTAFPRTCILRWLGAAAEKTPTGATPVFVSTTCA
jgi:hypothetical protein